MARVPRAAEVYGGAGVGSSCVRCAASTTLACASDPHESHTRRASRGALRLPPGLCVRSRGRALHFMGGGTASKRSTWTPPHARAVITKRLHAELPRSFVCGGLRTWASACPTSVCAWHACAAHDGACEHSTIASRVLLVRSNPVVGGRGK